MSERANERTVGLSDTLLLEIITQLGAIQRDIGGINAQLVSGSSKHNEFKMALEKLDARTDKIEGDLSLLVKPIADKVEGHDRTLLKHGAIIGKFAAVLGVASFIMIGAINFVWWGLQHLLPMAFDFLRHKTGG